MEIFWRGLFDLAISGEKCHSPLVPSMPGLAPPPYPQPTPKYGTIAEILSLKIGNFSALSKCKAIFID